VVRRILHVDGRYDAYDGSVQENPEDVTAYLSFESRARIEQEADKAWQEYWTCDPLTRKWLGPDL